MASAGADPENPSAALPKFTIKNVSLDDFSNESREHMNAVGLKTLSVKAYLRKQVLLRSDEFNRNVPGDRYAKATSRLQEALIGMPGRWQWGDYAALSYTWGDSNLSRQILINDYIFRVTDNLEEYLRAWVEDPTPPYFGIWIDAICINQQDLEERSVQVKRMRDIYQQAFVVAAWLGAEEEGSDKAIELLTVFANYNQGVQEQTDAFIENFRADPNFGPTGYWKALCDFLCRPYWDRLWIIQEIALSNGMLAVQCGRQMIPWHMLRSAVQLIDREFDLIYLRVLADFEQLGFRTYFLQSMNLNRISRISTLDRFAQIEHTGTARPKLIDLMAAVRMSKQRDGRDKIYGILSLLEPSLESLILPDYGLPLLDIFVDLQKQLFARKRV
jgi:hypothetical protein